MPEGSIARWRRLNRSARLYLLHAALLTFSLAIVGLFFNLAILALGYPRQFLGQLNAIALVAAAIFSLPLWWLATRMGLRRALLASAAIQAASALLFALWPAAAPLLLAAALSGVAQVLFQVSSPPFMMEQSDADSRDHLFSANAAINVGLAGVGALVAGPLPALFGRLLGVGAESALAYQGAFLVAGVGLLVSLAPLLLIERRETGDARPQSAVGSSQSTVHSPQFAVRSSQAGDRRRGKGDGGTETGDRQLPTGHWRLPTADRQLPTADRQLPTADWQLPTANWLARVPEPWRGMIRHPGPLLRLLAAPFLISWGAALLIPYLNLFFKERFDLADSALGLIFAALGISTGVASLAAPLISTRIGKMPAIVATQALSIPFLLILGFSPLVGLAVAAALARAALFNMGAPLYDAFAMERTPEAARPIVIGLINGAYSAGYLAGPLISTWAQERYGFAPIFAATACCYALAALANYGFFMRSSER